MRVLIVDNYDSFTFNLVQYLGELGTEPIVVRNDELPVSEAAALGADRLVISPGPGTPVDTGYSLDYLRELSPSLPTLGVCLGHQAIVEVYGGVVEPAPEPRHGKTSEITHDGAGVFAGLSNPLVATRYHSLAAVDEGPNLIVTAHSEDGVIQGVRHRNLPIEGVQFHPESIMTAEGMALLKNFVG
ncbi:MAG: aminodeoxychorismate/anthranilate synthase component II [Acidimicrobiia bacterium]|nr:aminodeoxychorismate/anthranilate synthase component II [Acidimicrobiia bacterium]MBT8216814.1 aminodeoxychorismate/anthranilate synthase component II [Acidimicrobiia bacterium]NNF09416.1 aminodeoxychorismate/anthranilate synthase component II [Acidimicrobiia bacterium]NNL69895.1 aminodeoxychorismate/anthranilate synthase component II [Acidimicrobiia bacterium]